MRIHKEGYASIVLVLLAAAIGAFFMVWCCHTLWLVILTLLLLLYAVGQVVFFFRIPSRKIVLDDQLVIAPADGKIVMIKEVEVDEYLHEKRLQVSIFMNLFNVHVNWYPVGGKIVYYKYHAGNKMVAWHPKSSEKNEHSMTYVKHNKTVVGVRQIAGLIARRIVCHAKAGKQVMACAELGIIKFGSRVDVILPLDAHVQVTLGQKVRGCESVIARL